MLHFAFPVLLFAGSVPPVPADRFDEFVATYSYRDSTIRMGDAGVPETVVRTGKYQVRRKDRWTLLHLSVEMPAVTPINTAEMVRSDELWLFENNELRAYLDDDQWNDRPNAQTIIRPPCAVPFEFTHGYALSDGTDGILRLLTREELDTRRANATAFGSPAVTSADGKRRRFASAPGSRSTAFGSGRTILEESKEGESETLSRITIANEVALADGSTLVVPMKEWIVRRMMDDLPADVLIRTYAPGATPGTQGSLPSEPAAIRDLVTKAPETMLSTEIVLELINFRRPTEADRITPEELQSFVGRIVFADGNPSNPVMAWGVDAQGATQRHYIVDPATQEWVPAPAPAAN